MKKRNVVSKNELKLIKTAVIRVIKCNVNENRLGIVTGTSIGNSCVVVRCTDKGKTLSCTFKGKLFRFKLVLEKITNNNGW